MNVVTSCAIGLCLVIPLLAGCADEQRLDRLPPSKNQLLTGDGRHIVSGDEGLYEIVKIDDTLRAKVLHSSVGSCNFAGLSQIRDWIFAVCQQRPKGLLGGPDNHLLTARVVQGQPLEFIQVERQRPDPMDLFFLPSDVSATPAGDLLVADFNLFKEAAIARLRLDFSGPVPRVVDVEKSWLDRSFPLPSAPDSPASWSQSVLMVDYSEPTPPTARPFEPVPCTPLCLPRY